MQLRPIQSRVVDELFAWWPRNPGKNALLELPTGAGKSVLIAGIIDRCYREFPDHKPRVLVLAPSTELIEQDLQKLLAIWPQAPVGVLSAGLGRRDYLSQILYGTIGTVYRASHEIGAFDLVFIDEAHGIPAGQQGMYRKLFAVLLGWNPDTRFVGLTATPFRGDGTWLTAIDNALFHGIASKVTIAEMLALGYLAPLTTPRIEQLIDVARVAVTAGDYNIGELAAATDQAAITERAMDIVVQQGAARRAWIAFGVTVEHAGHICDALKARGIAAAIVTGETPEFERRSLIAAFRAGRLRCLVTVLALLTGFDVPTIDLIAWLRPTKSPVLYVQGMGRGLRPAPGKTDCLVLDFTDTIERLGPIDRITGRDKKSKGKGEAPYRICPTCSGKCPTALLACPSCGHAFPPPERVVHGTMASDAAILAGAPKPNAYPVTRVAYSRHMKPGSPDSLRVDYYSGLRRVVSEWVSLERSGYARMKAESWWRRRCVLPVPGTVAEALDVTYALMEPASVTVSDAGQYPELLSVTWPDPLPAGAPGTVGATA